MKLHNGMKLEHTSTIKGVRYTTVSFFGGDKDIYDKIGGMIAESFQTAQFNTATDQDQSPAVKAG